VLALELYDHQNDPQENVNVAYRQEYAEVVRQLSALLDQDWTATRRREARGRAKGRGD
jgi:hypothetical protein